MHQCVRSCVLGENSARGGELRENVATYKQRRSPSSATQSVPEALSDGCRVAEWKIEKSLPVKKWKAALAAEVGDGNAQKLTTPPPEVPRWLEPCDPPGWPTVPLKSATLRYSLRIPNRWGATPRARGTAREIEHIYIGTRKAEWLIISFMEKATRLDRRTFELSIAMSGFPVMLDQNRRLRFEAELPGSFPGWQRS